MIKDITLGQYFPGNSILHRLDPRMKIVLVTAYIILLFFAQSALSYLLAAGVTFALMLLSGIPLKLYVRGLKPIVFIVIFTGIINMFYTSGNVLCSWWIFQITDLGIANAVRMILRIMLLVWASSMLTYTTSPVVLTNGLESLLSPLKVFHIPVHEFSMMVSLALRLIPTLIEETNRIMSAQKARGADFETGGLIRRMKAIIPIIVPLFISSFRRADELATAMQCRCYNGDSKNRTRLVCYSLHVRDYMSVVFMAAFFAGIILLNFITLFGVA